MSMVSQTIEFLRFGEATGIIRLSDRYIRTIDSEPAQEVRFEVSQENLEFGMKSFDYGITSGKPAGAVELTYQSFIDLLTPRLIDFLGISPSGDESKQLDIVTRAKELSQLPFEILEERFPKLVVTRRVRQPWPLPNVVRDDKPRILFAWAGGRGRASVPYERHRECLEKVLSDSGSSSDDLVELSNATEESLSRVLLEDRGFTHVHILAHGMTAEPAENTPAIGQPIDLDRELPAPTHLGLADHNGGVKRCSPSKLRLILSGPSWRPASVTLATCDSGNVDPIRSGSTLAHAVHEAGVPVVLASQFPLTKDGSDRLIDPFLAQIIAGTDPRKALKMCREALSHARAETYFDRLALVGYVHLDADLDQRLKQRNLNVALRRLTRISKRAEARIDELGKSSIDEKGLTPEQHMEVEQTARDFEAVRQDLAERETDGSLTKIDREEVCGLQGSAFKREAETSWKLSRTLSAHEAQPWLDHSRKMLRESLEAYRRAAESSRDHHWTWVQWLVLEAVTTGTLRSRRRDWVAAVVAAEDATALWPGEAELPDNKAEAEKAIFGYGSLCELTLLCPLTDGAAEPAGAEESLKRFTDRAFEFAREFGDDFTLTSTLAQLARYETWWGADPLWKLPNDIVERARTLHRTLDAQCRQAKPT